MAAVNMTNNKRKNILIYLFRFKIVTTHVYSKIVISVTIFCDIFRGENLWSSSGLRNKPPSLVVMNFFHQVNAIIFYHKNSWKWDPTGANVLFWKVDCCNTFIQIICYSTPSKYLPSDSLCLQYTNHIKHPCSW